MPSFLYHLKFELYPSFSPTSPIVLANRPVWLPPTTCDIFEELPGHSRSQGAVPLVARQDERPNDSVPPAGTRAAPDVIDCGAPRPAPTTKDERMFVPLSDRKLLQLRQRTSSFPPPHSYAAIKPETALKDWRFDRLRIESLDVGTSDMAVESTTTVAPDIGPSMSSAGKATKAKFVPFKRKNTEIGWGLVHLYREGDETPQLDAPLHDEADAQSEGEQSLAQRVDCTTVCIPAVPSYLSPSDFLGFIGERWRDHISHYRMVMTGRLNRYMVLMKFRESKQAQRFGREFDGRVFNDIEPETCNVAFIRSITFDTPTRPNESFPDLSQDPFTPASSSTATGSLKPLPPPTPNLIELPTCPVCLERMDDTTGLLTITCQHVFHCSCLQKWKGSGCPVCRHTNPYLSSPSSAQTPHDPMNPFSQPFGTPVSNLCSTCDSPDDLWICLICGNVGCGRYKGGHAKEHWKDTAHTFSLELDTQHVWDYAGDMWVHRLIRDKGDGKVVELPGRNSDAHSRRQDDDTVPRAKLESIGMEYTHLLTSQLESQRVYFEEMLSKAADKAAMASAAAEKASSQAMEAMQELRTMKEEHRSLTAEMIPSLEKDLARERTRATKATELAREMGKSLQDEKKVSEGLMKRIEHVNTEMETLKEQVQSLGVQNADLKDQNHDLTMFISGQEKLKEMEAEGQLDAEDLEEGSASVPEKKRLKGKGKNRS